MASQLSNLIRNHAKFLEGLTDRGNRAELFYAIADKADEFIAAAYRQGQADLEARLKPEIDRLEAQIDRLLEEHELDVEEAYVRGLDDGYEFCREDHE